MESPGLRDRHGPRRRSRRGLSVLKRLRSRLAALARRRRFEEDLAEEVSFHMEEHARELVRSGMSAHEAARRARLEFGGVDNVKDDCREARGLRLFDEIGQDLRHALRVLRGAPGFTATGLATLALCLGANLAIFALVDSVLLRPLPFPAPDRLVRVFNSYPKAGVADDGCSVTNYYERRGEIAGFTGLAAYRHGAAIVGEAGTTDRVEVTRVTAEFFSTLGAGPVRGRAFTEEEMTHQTDGVAVLTHGYWREQLGGDPNVVGRTLKVDGLERRVVGVLPPEFRFLSSRSRIYLPWASNVEDREPRRRHWGSSSQMIARLRPSASLAQAQSQLDAHNAAREADAAEARMMAEVGFRTLVVPLHADHVAALRSTLLLVQGGALLLLLIGAVNLVNLFLIRASSRAKELAVRQAIGASRWRLARAVLVETLLLTSGGALLGLAVGAGGTRLLAVLGADRLPLGSQIAFDARAGLVAVCGAIVLGIAIGAPIAWQSLRTAALHALHSESRSSTASRAAQRTRHGFLVAQVAVAFVLLSGAGLLGQSLRQAMAVSPGFRPESVMSGHLFLPWKSYPQGAARLAFMERVLEALRRRPGVLTAGMVTNVPLSGDTNKSAARVKGHTLRREESPHGIYSYSVAGDAFETLGVSLIEGRFLAADDSRRPERVCVVDEDFARYYWPGRSALGQRLFQGGQVRSDAEAFTVVGVVAAVKQAGLTDDARQGAVYYPYRHWSGNSLFLVARTSQPPDRLGKTLQDVVRQVDPELPLSDLRSMETRVADSLLARRSPAVLAGLFSAVAVQLTAVGIYGVLSYAVAQRRREIGLRIALGAQPQQVRAQFVRLALRLLAAGIALGLGGAWLTGRAMQVVLFEVPPLHLPTLAGTAVTIMLVSLFACLLPAHRAAQVSPMETLATD